MQQSVEVSLGLLSKAPHNSPLVKWKETYWCYFSVLVFLFALPWKIFCRRPWKRTQLLNFLSPSLCNNDMLAVAVNISKFSEVIGKITRKFVYSIWNQLATSSLRFHSNKVYQRFLENSVSLNCPCKRLAHVSNGLAFRPADLRFFFAGTYS